MSRHDPCRPPVIHPATLRRWRLYRAEWARDWAEGCEKIVDGVTRPDGEFRRYEYMPEPLHFSTTRFRSFRAREDLLDWDDEEAYTPHGRQHVPTARWEEGAFKVVVRQIPYDMDDWSTYGKFTDSPESESYGETWGTMFFVDPILRKQLREALKKEFGFWDPPKGFEGAWDALKETLRKRVGYDYPKRLHKRALRGPDSRHAWRAGAYDTFQGNDDHPDRGRKYRYIQLYEYDYDELREWYWLLGRSKREADELARQEFRSRVKFMEKIAKGEVSDTFVEAKVYRADDEDEEDELASEGTSTVVDTDFASEKRHLDETAREVAREALFAAKKQLAEDDPNPLLPGVQ